MHLEEFIPDESKHEIKLLQHYLLLWLKDNADRFVNNQDYAHTNKPFHSLWCISSAFGDRCHLIKSEIMGVRFDLARRLNRSLSIPATHPDSTTKKRKRVV